MQSLKHKGNFSLSCELGNVYSLKTRILSPSPLLMDIRSNNTGYIKMLTLRRDFPPEKGIMQGKPHYPGHFFVFCIVRQRWERSQCNASPISILRFSKMMEKKELQF